MESWLLDDDGDLDDVTVSGVKTFRMERMDHNYWWLCLYTEDGREIHMDLVVDQSGMVLTRRE